MFWLILYAIVGLVCVAGVGAYAAYDEYEFEKKDSVTVLSKYMIPAAVAFFLWGPIFACGLLYCVFGWTMEIGSRLYLRFDRKWNK